MCHPHTGAGPQARERILQRPGELPPSCHDSGAGSLVPTSLGQEGGGQEECPSGAGKLLSIPWEGQGEQPCVGEGLRGPQGARECLVPALTPGLAGEFYFDWMPLSG